MKCSKFLLNLLTFKCLQVCILCNQINDYHSCLVSYLSTIGLVEDSLKEGTFEKCSEQRKNLNENFILMYNDLQKNLYEVLANNSEVECLVKSFKQNKFLEANIVMTSAILTAETFNRTQLNYVFEESKRIFTIAALECLINDQIVMEIFKDFSVKLNVGDDEFVCIEKYLKNFTISKGINDEESEETTEKIKSGRSFLEVGKFKKIKLEKSSVESTSLDEENKRSTEELKETLQSCDKTLETLNMKIMNFHFPSMNEIQNNCMKLKFDDIFTVYKFIALNKFSANSKEIEIRNESLKKILLKTIWNIIECTDLLNLADIINDFLPIPGTTKSADE